MMIIRGVNVFPSQIETVLLNEGYTPNYMIYVDRKNLPMDILEPSATWRYGGEAYPVKLVHWGSFGTMKAQYLLEVQRLDRDLAGKPLSPLAARLLYCLLLRHDFATLLKRVRLRVRLFVKTGHSKP